MNLKFIIILFTALLIIAGCEENQNKIEENKNNISVVTIDDSDYYSPFKTDSITSPELIKADTSVNKFERVFKNLDLPHPYFLARLFINEKGMLDKIVIINGINKKIDNMIIENVKSWEFSPARKNGKAVKYQGIVSFSRNMNHFNFSPPYISDYFTRPKSGFYVAVERMPEPIGGLRAIQNKIHYPEIAKRAGVEGKVYIKAYIDTNGNVVHTETIKGLGTGLDEVAERAIKETKFKPGVQRGKPVKTQVVVPIIFKLDSSKTKKTSEDKFFHK